MTTPRNGTSADQHPYDPAAAGLRTQAEQIAPDTIAADPLARSGAASAPVSIAPLFPKGVIK
jgi:hypothetical protein